MFRDVLLKETFEDGRNIVAPFESGHRFQCAAGFEHPETGVEQDLSRRHSDQGFVLDDQDARSFKILFQHLSKSPQ